MIFIYQLFYVYGKRAPRRVSQFAAGAPIPTRDQNLALDTIIAEVQELARDRDRGVKMAFDAGSGLIVDADIADGDLLMKSGDRLVKGPDAADIEAVQNNAVAAHERLIDQALGQDNG